jgi:hypothetical protein
MDGFLQESILGLEPYLDERVASAKQRARKIANGSVDSELDLRDYLVYYIATKYNMPIFSEYFQARTLDDLIYESELLSLRDRPKEQLASDITNEHKDEADALFDDWAAEDQWNDVPPPISSELDEAAKKFMTTNQWSEI